jgi:hypothetical protein
MGRLVFTLIVAVGLSACGGSGSGTETVNIVVPNATVGAPYVDNTDTQIALDDLALAANQAATRQWAAEATGRIRDACGRVERVTIHMTYPNGTTKDITVDCSKVTTTTAG